LRQNVILQELYIAYFSKKEWKTPSPRCPVGSDGRQSGWPRFTGSTRRINNSQTGYKRWVLSRERGHSEVQRTTGKPSAVLSSYNTCLERGEEPRASDAMLSPLHAAAFI
jgi:hypothetical protein